MTDKTNTDDIPGIKWPRVIPWGVAVTVVGFVMGVSVGFGSERQKLVAVSAKVERMAREHDDIKREMRDRMAKLEKSLCVVCTQSNPASECPVCK